jgi:hypothetical protein
MTENLESTTKFNFNIVWSKEQKRTKSMTNYKVTIDLGTLKGTKL